MIFLEGDYITMSLRKIYGFSDPKFNMEINIGDTTKNDSFERINEETGELGSTVTLWVKPATDNLGKEFHDYQFHSYIRSHINFLYNDKTKQHLFLTKNKPHVHREWYLIVPKGKDKNGIEWRKYTTLNEQQIRYIQKHYTCSKKYTEELFNLAYKKFINYRDNKHSSISLCLFNAQRKVAKKASNYLKYHTNRGKFLIDAKPRFGKTPTSLYIAINDLHAKDILIITQKPSTLYSWKSNVEKFYRDTTNQYDFKGYKFISNNKNLLNNNRAISEQEYQKKYAKNYGQVVFISLTDAKIDSNLTNVKKKKFNWVRNIHWDITIIDEVQDSVYTKLTYQVLNNLHSKGFIYMSGTPYKALQSQEFTPKQIAVYGYIDEMKEKHKILKLLKSGKKVDKIEQKMLNNPTIHIHTLPNPYDLSQLYKNTVKNGFVNEKEVKQVLENLYLKDNQPYGKKYVQYTKNALWFCGSRISTARNLAKLLVDIPFFAKHYRIIVAAGEQKGYSSYQKVENAIHATKNHMESKVVINRRKCNVKPWGTITLTINQLTSSVTIPEWSTVLFLSTAPQSLALYIQTMFRAQTPSKDKRVTNIFDMMPLRAEKMVLRVNHIYNQFHTKSHTNILNYARLYKNINNQEKVITNASTLSKIINNTEIRSLINSGFKSTHIINSQFIQHDWNTKIAQMFKDNSNQNIANQQNRVVGFKDKRQLLQSKVNNLQEQEAFLKKQKKYSKISDYQHKIKELESEMNNNQKVNHKMKNKQNSLQKKLEKKYAKRRNQLQGFIKTIPVLILIYGTNHKIFKLNQIIASISNDTLKAVTGLTKTDYHYLAGQKHTPFNMSVVNQGIKDYVQHKWLEE